MKLQRKISDNNLKLKKENTLREKAEKAWKSVTQHIVKSKKLKDKKLWLKNEWKKDEFIKWYKEWQENGKRICHYCHIEEDEFIKKWGRFYNTRGERLEVDRKNNKTEYSKDECTLACALCNCAKSNKLNYSEALELGKTIEKLWKTRG